MTRQFFVWRWWFAGFPLFGLLFGLVYSAFVTPIYEASIKVLPSEQIHGDGFSLGGLGGLADLAGIGEVGGDRAKYEALEVLRSRAFGEQFLVDAGILPALCADNACAVSRFALVGGRKDAPTPADGYRRFSKLLHFQEDRRTGVITLTLRWHDPAQAAEWLNSLVAKLNEAMRQRAYVAATQSLAYLNEQIASADLVELRAVLFRLLQDEIKKSMLTKINPEYALRVIDPALPPQGDEYVWPNLLLLTLFGAVIGGGVGLGAALLMRPPAS
ncbi:MAG: hypothetical protein H6979_03970 [Chromatiales bacterium]|nr:hypothetical protein [Chromatiales bacterium]